jgi:heme-degrading monooxygenase HmoA
LFAEQNNYHGGEDILAPGYVVDWDAQRRCHDSRDLRSLASRSTGRNISISRRTAADPETIDGFISVGGSKPTRRKKSSRCRFGDEEAVAAWRNLPGHRKTQGKGRAKIFENYRLRIAGVVRDYGMNERAQAPNDSRAVHGAH